MDSRGIINIELLFCTLIIILLLIAILPMIDLNIDSSMQINENSQGRFLLNHVSNSINEVNSKEYGFNKRLCMPDSINGNHYSVLVNGNEVILEFNKKKGKSNINPIRLVDHNNKTIESVQLFNGRSYLIKKSLVNNNDSHTINQSSIEIKMIG